MAADLGNLRGMVTPEAAPVVDVLTRLRDHRRAERQLLAERDQAYVAWQQATGVPTATAGLTLREVLTAEGWTEDDRALVGVSKATVRASLERPRQPV